MNTACWKLPSAELVGLSPRKARDLMVECFYFAQHETLARTKQRLGATDVDEGSVRSSVVGVVRAAFREVGGSFDEPTAASLAAVADLMARRAEGWGTPPDVVRHHHDQVMAMLGRLAA